MATKGPASDWTDERVESLKAMVEQGYSFSWIARTLGGVSRNACIGKAGRLGLTIQNPSGYHHERSVQPVRSLNPKPKPVPKEPVPVVPEPESLRIGLLDLTSRQCHFPIGDPQTPEFGFCGHAKTVEVAYCPYHRGVAFRKDSVQARRSWGAP